ncbi:MAG: hypothetical protein K0S24_3989 [Sphingobacterium sp.]|jgi:hypothetical protein|nr:hypothetical protein [Sphingobacterium sp.]
MHATYNVFRFEVLKVFPDAEISVVLRHYRRWQKIYKGFYRTLTMQSARQTTREYIAESLPSADAITLKDCADLFNVAYSESNISRMLKKSKIEIMDTVKGYYISLADYERMKSLKNYRSLRLLFMGCIKDCKSLNQNEIGHGYEAFKKACKRYVTEIEELSFLPDCDGDVSYYPPEAESSIDVVFCNWIALQYSEQAGFSEDSVSLSDGARQLDVGADELLSFIRECPEAYVTDGFAVCPKVSAINGWRIQQGNSVWIGKIVDEIRTGYKNINQTDGMNAVLNFQSKNQYKLFYQGREVIGLSAQKWYYNKNSEPEVKKLVSQAFDALKIMPIESLNKITGFPVSVLKKKAQRGLIDAVDIDGRFLISRLEWNRINELAKQIVGLDEVICDLHCSADFDYNKAPCRNHMYDFIIENDVWGINLITTDSVWYKKIGKNLYFIDNTDVAHLQKHLKLWLRGYKASNRQKVKILIDQYKSKFPKTCKAIWGYFGSLKLGGLDVQDLCVKQAIDYLLSVLPDEISRLNESEIHDILNGFREDMSLAASDAIASFLYDCGYIAGRCDFKSTGVAQDTNAYTAKETALMAYTTLNPDVWIEKNMLVMAAENHRYADCWLFIMLHFVAAWRSTDLIRLPIPQLAYSPEETLRRIKAGSYPDEVALQIEAYLERAVEIMEMCPHKTEQHSYVPLLRLYVPESCKVPFGIVLSIATAHYELDSKTDIFVRRIRDIRTIHKFFGKEFADACGNKDFSTRRANKALLQGVYSVAEDRDGQPKPYLLAALMRSHKGGYATLPETTEIYLKDAKFSGESPEFILYQMLERGICSFAVDLLLIKYFGSSYQTLPIVLQTSLIKTVGLSAYEVQSIEQMIQDAENQAVTMVQSIFTQIGHNSDEKIIAANIVNAVLNDCGTGKNNQSICLLLAAGMKCRCPMRSLCLGCAFEIRTKSTLSFYTSEAKRISSELQSMVEQNSLGYKRNEYAMKHIILPAIYEIAVHMEKYTSAEEFIEYRNLLKVVV